MTTTVKAAPIAFNCLYVIILWFKMSSNILSVARNKHVHHYNVFYPSADVFRSYDSPVISVVLTFEDISF